MKTPKSAPLETDEPSRLKGVQSIEVGFQILAVIVRSPVPLNLTAIAAAADMSASSAFRYLQSFSRMGLVERRLQDNLYQLGEFAFRIGLAAIDRLDWQQVAQDEMMRLRDATNLTISLAVWNGRGSVVVRWVESTRPVTVNVRVGTVLSPVKSPSGRLFAAYLPGDSTSEVIDQEFSRGEHFTYMGKPLSRSRYESLLVEVSRRGLDRVEGDVVLGVDAVSAPIFNHAGKVIMTLTAIGSHGTVDISWDGPIAQAVRAAGRAASTRLGFTDFELTKDAKNLVEGNSPGVRSKS